MEMVNAKLIEEIVRRVIQEQLSGKELQKFDKSIDVSGVALVKANTVKCDPFDTGKKGDQVFLLDVFSLEESPRMGCGIMEMKETEFDWKLCYDEIDYIIEGTLEITVGGKKVTGKAGDIMFIPRNTTITFGCPDYVRFMYVTYPANWAQQT
ncbi:MAG: DUF861 domain-containing protein [Alkaliphilus sp.]|nr:DUF861 domain-containing protein [Alkaliphilus sp.]